MSARKIAGFIWLGAVALGLIVLVWLIATAEVKWWVGV